MRILYFSRGYSPHDHRFLSALADTSHDIHFLQLERHRQSDDRPIPGPVNQVFWREKGGEFSWGELLPLRRALKGILRKVAPDVVHAGPVQHCAFLTALAGFRPLVTMSWGSDMLKDAHRNGFWRWITRFTLKRSTILLGDCQAVADEAHRFGFPRERIVLFPWGVDLERFHPAKAQDFRARLGWEDCFVLLSLRSWEPLYGVDTFLQGFVKAARECPDLRLLLLGKGSQAGLLRNILMEAGLLDRVHFGGQVSQADLPRYYQVADLYVSASHSDGSSVSLLEALASGVPVLVSDIPGNLEWIQEGTNGWLFPDGDSEAISKKIIAAYHNREKLAPLQAVNRALAEARADWSKNFQKLQQAYDLAQQAGVKRG